MKTKHISHRFRNNGLVMALGAIAIVASFSGGLYTSADVTTIDTMSAQDVLPGDLNFDGVVTVEDVAAALDIALDVRPASPDELRADPNGDGSITVHDARAIADLAF